MVEALRTLNPTFFANPSSVHASGRASLKILNEAKDRIVESVGASRGDYRVVFGSSGTEVNQQVIKSLLNQDDHWIVSETDHESVIEMVEWHRSRGGSVDFLRVDEDGLPRLDQLEILVKPTTRLLSCAWVNNETGVITPAQKLVEWARAHNVQLHLDAAQAWGKIPMNLSEISADFVTLSSHKIGAPAGCGIVLVKRPEMLRPLVRGSQEGGLRGGTPNVLGAWLTGIACGVFEFDQSPLADSRDFLEEELSKIEGALVNGSCAPRVSNTLNVSFVGVGKGGLVPALDLKGYQVSAGSACSSGAAKPSRVLMAMGRTSEQAAASIRISLCEVISREFAVRFASDVKDVVSEMRTLRPSR